MSVKHSKISTIPDGVDPNLLEGSDWNAAHVIEDGTITEQMLAPGVILAGPTGPSGAPGNRWLTGHGIPSNANGNDGDLYLNLDTGDIYDKASGTWF